MIPTPKKHPTHSVAATKTLQFEIDFSGGRSWNKQSKGYNFIYRKLETPTHGSFTDFTGGDTDTQHTLTNRRDIKKTTSTMLFHLETQ